ncbi:MAG TPA: right-handed parallel beta-helix repeat-containing protein [Chthonomonadaceae bacterium]|nr:right-handed parallel beta-helix repeat-containing protein [Chthonomonadaceae bacterium]
MSQTLTAGADTYQGETNEAIQRIVDAVAAAGGGVARIPAGIYRMHNALHLRSGVRVVGEEGAVLVKVPSVASPIADYLGYGFYEFTVQEPEKFCVGMGVRIADDNAGGFYQTVATIVARQGDTFFVDRMFAHDYLPDKNGSVASLFPLVVGYDVTDASVENLALDGNEEETRDLNGCRGGGVFLLGSQRVRIEGVEVRNYRGDAVSFQQCTDIQVRRCHLHHNTGTGLHPGSGSVRYLLEENHVHDNGNFGLYYCLRTSHSHCLNNRLERNGSAGISIGERDTDHLIRGNTVVGNEVEGIVFRPCHARGGDRVIVEGNRIGPNCTRKGDCEILIYDGLHDIHILGNAIEPGRNAALRVGDRCERLSFAENTVSGRRQEPTDIAGHAGSVRLERPSQLPPVGPSALPMDGARHLHRESLPPWKA